MPEMLSRPCRAGGVNDRKHHGVHFMLFSVDHPNPALREAIRKAQELTGFQPLVLCATPEHSDPEQAAMSAAFMEAYATEIAPFLPAQAAQIRVWLRALGYGGHASTATDDPVPPHDAPAPPPAPAPNPVPPGQPPLVAVPPRAALTHPPTSPEPPPEAFKLPPPGQELPQAGAIEADGPPPTPRNPIRVTGRRISPDTITQG